MCISCQDLFYNVIHFFILVCFGWLLGGCWVASWVVNNGLNAAESLELGGMGYTFIYMWS